MHIELSTEQIEYLAERKAAIIREMDVAVGWRNEASVDDICDECGTSRYDIDLFRAIGGDYDAHCCDMEGYTV